MRIDRALNLIGIATLFVYGTVLHADTTYTYFGPQLGMFSGNTLQGVDRVSGEFTTAAPLAANINSVDISPLILSYFFSDGQYSWDPSNSSLSGINGGFTVNTNEVGTISFWDLLLVGEQQITLPGNIPATLSEEMFSEGCGVFSSIPTAFYPCWGDEVDQSVIFPPEYVDAFFPINGRIYNDLQQGSWSTPEPSVGFPLMAISLAVAAIVFRRTRHSAQPIPESESLGVAETQ